MSAINAIVVAAQDVEIQPFLKILDGRDAAAADDADQAERVDDGGVPLAGSARKTQKISAPLGFGWLVHTSNGRILALRTGVGLAATAGALGWALCRYSPRCVLSIGSAGGLAGSTRVLDVVAGSAYAYGTADATAFGYERGQVPGQPVAFPGDEDLLGHVGADVKTGLMLSGDSFVTARNVGDMRQAFPKALTTDMESAAAAQICAAWDIPFASIRCVSDLCGPEAGQDYHVAVEKAASASANAAVRALGGYIGRPVRGRSPLFDRAAVNAALLLMLAKSRRLEPSANLAGLAEDIEEATREQLSETPGFVDEALGLIAAAQEEITSHPEVSITAKAYDAARAELIKSLGGTPDSGQITWPPTSQTVSKRSNGYWNDALAQLGLRVRAGRQRGAAKFTDEDYLDTLRAFANWTERFGLKPTVAAYGRWLNEGFSGEARPSSAAIRQHFGTWRAALATVSQ
mgnify:FL=1|jgi:MTA/SAH nucleosidase